ncbi:MAG: hypothetical protein KA713_07110 [Chryseotalea sp. WA131a]|nr:MAG: hypothetical protein KA713_07110 [Chryseotalea sp. WA131a]
MKKRFVSNMLIVPSMLLFPLLCISCKDQEKTEKFQSHRTNILDVEKELTNINTDIILGSPLLYIISDYLIVLDMKPSTNKGIHLFNKNSFKYVASTGIMGDGPGEIIRYGRIGVDNDKQIFWVPDHGKQMLMKFPLDSVLQNPNFKPTTGLSLLNDLFIERFEFLDDSIVLGKAVNVLSSSSYQMVMAKLNTISNRIDKYGYEQPESGGKKSNSYFALSKPHNFYVNCYLYCDLVTICDLKGNLRYNIYGPDRMDNKENMNTYFTGVDLFKNIIFAAYIGDAGIVFNEFKRQEGSLPTKFLIFNQAGDYLNTFETKHKFSSFCIDEANSRVIAHYMDRTNPLAYFTFDSSLAVADK